MSLNIRTCICPVCGVSVNQDHISQHVEHHFSSPSKETATASSTNCDLQQVVPGTSQGKDQKFMSKFVYFSNGLVSVWFGLQVSCCIQSLLIGFRAFCTFLDLLPKVCGSNPRQRMRKLKTWLWMIL